MADITDHDTSATRRRCCHHGLTAAVAFMLAVSASNGVYVFVMALTASWHVRAGALIGGYAAAVAAGFAAGIFAYRRNQMVDNEAPASSEAA